MIKSSSRVLSDIAAQKYSNQALVQPKHHLHRIMIWKRHFEIWNKNITYIKKCFLCIYLTNEGAISRSRSLIKYLSSNRNEIQAFLDQCSITFDLSDYRFSSTAISYQKSILLQCHQKGEGISVVKLCKPTYSNGCVSIAILYRWQ